MGVVLVNNDNNSSLIVAMIVGDFTPIESPIYEIYVDPHFFCGYLMELTLQLISIHTSFGDTV